MKKKPRKSRSPTGHLDLKTLYALKALLDETDREYKRMSANSEEILRFMAKAVKGNL